MIINLNTTKYGPQAIIIDDEDFEKYAKHTWTLYSTKRHSSIYVVATYTKRNNYESVRLHRLIMNAKPGEIVDHMNGNGLDNRKSNLRITNSTGNNQNVRKRKNALTSKYKGVHQVKTKWIAQIQFQKKKINLGMFKTEVEAAEAYNKAALTLFKEFAKLNIIE